MIKVNLENADFSIANLIDANLTDSSNCDRAIFKNTIMPDCTIQDQPIFS